MKLLPFDFEIPMTVFEKADAEVGKQRRIGGIASLETKDRQGETLLQRGLNFDDFLINGWFNDNHSRATTGVLGYPEAVQFFTKGQTLPNSKKAEASGHWVEGYLLDTDEADAIWKLGKALEKTKRNLGFSVEGKIHKRIGTNNKTIAQALVRNVAITNCPVNVGAKMEILAKSLQVVEQTEPTLLERALTMGAVPDPGQPSVGPKTGKEAGQVITPESLEEDEKKTASKAKSNTAKSVVGFLTNQEACAWVSARLPSANTKQVERFLQLARSMREHN